MSDFVQLVFDISEIVGTIAFAASGAMLAIDRELDLFGVLLLGVITAVGGGAIRDILLGTFPPNAFTNSIYVLMAFLTSLVVFLFGYLKGARYWKERARIDRVINLLDAVGLGIFSVIGVRTAIDKGFDGNAFLCIFMGMMTGVGGGILRDMMSQTVPAVFRNRIYAVASIAGSAMYYFSLRLGIEGAASMFIGMGGIVLIRILATKYAWDLPKVTKI